MMQLLGFGHSINSDLPIPGSLTWDAGGRDRAPPLSITLAPEQHCAVDTIYRRANDALLFTPPGVGQFWCRPDRIDVVPDPDGDREMLTALLIATALPATQWMRGHFMLHGSALVLPDRTGAIAVSGVSGSGKSTVAAALLARQASLVADDSLRIVNDGGSWRAAGLPGGLFVTDAGPTRRRFEPIAIDRAVAETRLDAIFVLGKRDISPTIQRLDGTDAIKLLLAMQHRPRIPACWGLRAEVLKLAAGIARSLPVFLWQRRNGGIALEQTEWDMLQRSCGDEG